MAVGGISRGRFRVVLSAAGEFGVVQARVGGTVSCLVVSVLVGAWGAGRGRTVVEIVVEVRPGWEVP